MLETPLHHLLEDALVKRRRLVAPLMGFPGLTLTGSTIKLAQQNVQEQVRTLKALAETFEPDLIFTFMDLSVEANALGLPTVFPVDDSPTVQHGPLTEEDLERMGALDITWDTRLQGYAAAVRLMALTLAPSTLRGAYVTGPYTLAALIMGAEEAAMATVLDPSRLARLCRLATDAALTYVRQLVAAGAQVICVLEPSAVMLGAASFRRFSAEYVREIATACRGAGAATLYHVCGNATHLIDAMVESGVDGLSLDSAEAGIDLPAIATRVPPAVILIGNVNPTGRILHGTPAEVADETSALLKQMAPYDNFVLSTGCDLPQKTPLENIAAFMETGRAYRR